MGGRYPVHDPRGLIEIHRPTLLPGPGPPPARKDPLIDGHLPGRSPATATARQRSPSLAFGAATREPTPRYPLLPSRTQAVAVIDDRPGQAGGACAGPGTIISAG